MISLWFPLTGLLYLAVRSLLSLRAAVAERDCQRDKTVVTAVAAVVVLAIVVGIGVKTAETSGWNGQTVQCAVHAAASETGPVCPR
jgi:hypothetical protein